MQPSFKLPVKLNADSQLIDGFGRVIVPNFHFGTQDWARMQGQERNALFLEWWTNQYPALMKIEENRKILHVTNEPDWSVIMASNFGPESKRGLTKMDRGATK